MDIFHVSEHISGCGKALFKDEEQQRCWFEDKRMLLLRKGFCGVNAELVQEYKSGLYDEEQQSAIGSLQDYLFNNRNRLSYSERLFAGRAIGSGVVEGACWRLRQAEKMTVLCAALYSNQWKYCWKAP
ncbi:hypothetical protein FACS189427_02390 [Planctomycetales bacterium]|nr:hypothetical protein FACS189427_02390 [Planctomycetales bacterium]